MRQVASRVCAHDRDLDLQMLHVLRTTMSSLSRLAVPFVYALIFALGYPSQWLLMQLEPGPLTKNELITANVTLLLIWITYTRSVFVDPGTIPKDWAGKELGEKKGGGEGEAKDDAVKSRKWCRKCDAAKPPRAHHCKECGRCVDLLLVHVYLYSHLERKAGFEFLV